jgi:hypothetical protein
MRIRAVLPVAALLAALGLGGCVVYEPAPPYAAAPAYPYYYPAYPAYAYPAFGAVNVGVGFGFGGGHHHHFR